MTTAPTTSRFYSAAIAIYVALNAFDLLTTLALVSIKVAEEQNPLMAYFLTKGPLAFAAVKAGLTALTAYGFWRVRRSPSAWATLTAALTIYVVLVAYQTYLINQLFQTLKALVP